MFSEKCPKNAWKIEDYPAIEIALRAAVREAGIASSLDPGHTVARVKVASMKDKLTNLLAVPHSEPPTTNPSTFSVPKESKGPGIRFETDS